MNPPANAVTIAFSTTIACPVNRVWEVFADTEKLCHWVRGLESFSITSPPPHGEGATYDMRMREGRRIRTYHGRNLIWNPQQLVREEMWGGSLKPQELITMEYRFEDRQSITVLRYSNTFRAIWLRRGIFFVFGRMYCKSMIGSFKKLAEDSLSGSS